jgi:hypothetical protein
MKHVFTIFAFWTFNLAFAFGWTNAPIRELKLYKTYSDSAQIFDKAVKLSDLNTGVGYFLQHTVNNCRSNAAAQGKSPQSIGSMGGHWLEWAVLIALKQKGLTPAYWQAEFTAVPRAFNDVLVWSKEYGPVILSCKTSLRERYKQADLEAVALKNHFPDGKFYLVTLEDDAQHLKRVRSKIADKEILALQAIYAADNADELFAFLKTLKLTEPDPKLLHSATVVR